MFRTHGQRFLRAPSKPLHGLLLRLTEEQIKLDIMKDSVTSKIIQAISDGLEIPPSAYERADARYKSLGDWFGRPNAESQKYSPHIYPQGSFRLGTVSRPLI